MGIKRQIRAVAVAVSVRIGGADGERKKKTLSAGRDFIRESAPTINQATLV